MRLVNHVLDPGIGAAPNTSAVESKSSGTSTLLGRDFPGTKFEIVANEGTSIVAGEPVLRDRRSKEILFTSPVSGTVSAIRRGTKRRLIALQIARDDEEDTIGFDIPAKPTGADIRRLMLASGLWTTLRSRPFGQIPNPDQNPKALMVTAIDTQPLAPDPAVVIAKFPKEFSLGIKTIEEMIDVPIYLCKSSRNEILLDNSARTRVAEFDGAHPAGLPGTHIHALSPIDFSSDQVWHIDYQDVISLGHLFSTGSPWYQRVVSLAGSAVKNPRLLLVPIGSGTEDITTDELVDCPTQIFSGSILSGHAAVDSEASLGQRHHQITAIPRTNQTPQKWWAIFRPGFRTIQRSSETDSDGDPAPLIPTTDLDAVSPPGILAVPMLRALLVGDIERARDLGALALVEEDLDLLSYVCSSRIDYGLLLRGVLNQLQKEGVSHG